MASLRRAKSAASRKSKQVYRTNIKKPKRQVVKKFANFVGKVTFKRVKVGKGKRSYKKGRRGYRRRSKRRRY